MLKLVIPKEIPKKAYVWSGDSAIFQRLYAGMGTRQKYFIVLFGNHRQQITGSLLLIRFYMAI